MARHFSKEQIAYIQARALFEVAQERHQKNGELIDAEAEKLGIPTPYAVLAEDHPLMRKGQELLDAENEARTLLYTAAHNLFDWATESTLARVGTAEQKASIRKAVAEVKTMAHVEPFFEQMVKISMELDTSLPTCATEARIGV